MGTYRQRARKGPSAISTSTSGSVAESRDKLSPAPHSSPSLSCAAHVSLCQPTTSAANALLFYHVRYGVRWFTFSRSDVLPENSSNQRPGFRTLGYAHLLPNLLCTKRKTPDRMRHTNPTPMYATPRNGFLPPSHDVLEMINFLVPLNEATG